ncbi:hypothetical protein KIPB_003756, partial [Kipferlia bialata]|eukprot:g3756.t1
MEDTSGENFVFTSESVCEGHPDKVGSCVYRFNLRYQVYMYTHTPRVFDSLSPTVLSAVWVGVPVLIVGLSAMVIGTPSASFRYALARHRSLDRLQVTNPMQGSIATSRLRDKSKSKKNSRRHSKNLGSGPDSPLSASKASLRGLPDPCFLYKSTVQRPVKLGNRVTCRALCLFVFTLVASIILVLSLLAMQIISNGIFTESTVVNTQPSMVNKETDTEALLDLQEWVDAIMDTGMGVQIHTHSSDTTIPLVPLSVLIVGVVVGDMFSPWGAYIKGRALRKESTSDSIKRRVR